MRHLVLLRHGRTASSEGGLFTGRKDVPLSEDGRADARAWVSPFHDLGADAGLVAATSPLQRCVETAQLAGLHAETDPLLLEWDLGDLDGMHADGYRAENPAWNLFQHGAPGGESPDDVADRIDEALAAARASERDVVFVTHGQFSKAFLARALGLPLAAARSLSLGPARAALLLQRPHGLSLAGWNLPATSDNLWRALT